MTPKHKQKHTPLSLTERAAILEDPSKSCSFSQDGRLYLCSVCKIRTPDVARSIYKCNQPSIQQQPHE